eukprot:gene32979-39884_t
MSNKVKKEEENLVEKVKKTLFLKGRTSSQTMNDVLKDLALMAKPYAKTFHRKNDIIPFEDAHSLEFLGPKNDCGLFALASHSKKRPNNLVLGRLYDGHILDMYEFGVTDFHSVTEFPGSKKAIGSKPMMIFLGDLWQIDAQYGKIQNLLLDFFRGFKADKLSLEGIDHVVTCAIHEGTISVRVYYVNYRKSTASKVPELVLQPMGPSMDLLLRRTQMASEDMWKTAIRRPKILEQSKVKNITRTDMGDKVGRIHMKKQNLDSMGGRRIKALRNSKRGRDAEGGDGAEKPKRSRSA